MSSSSKNDTNSISASNARQSAIANTAKSRSTTGATANTPTSASNKSSSSSSDGTGSSGISNVSGGAVQSGKGYVYTLVMLISYITQRTVSISWRCSEAITLSLRMLRNRVECLSSAARECVAVWFRDGGHAWSSLLTCCMYMLVLYCIV